MKYSNVLSLLIFTLFVFACNDKVEPTIAPDIDDGDKNGDTEGTFNVKIDLNKTYQVIESFSASDCWTPNYIGRYWEETEKDRKSVV